MRKRDVHLRHRDGTGCGSEKAVSLKDLQTGHLIVPEGGGEGRGDSTEENSTR